MSDHCPNIQPACAHAFHEIALSSAQLSERSAAMDEKLDDLCQAVLGNGNPHDSLCSRVERLEAASARTWKVVGVCAVVLAALVAAFGLIK